MHNILLPFALIIFTGVVFRRFKIGELDANLLRHAINITVLNIFLPALCIKVIYTTKIDIEMILVPATAWISIISGMLLSAVVYTILGKKMHIKPSEKGVLILSSAFGNVTYLGLPVLTGLYGYEAARYALFYDLLASCFIEGAMPTMVLSLLIAARFKLDVSMSAFTIVVSTIFSFITLPFAIHIARFLVR